MATGSPWKPGPLNGLSQTKDSHAQDSLISPLHTSLFNLLVLDAPYTERYVRCGERTGANHPLLLDLIANDNTTVLC